MGSFNPETFMNQSFEGANDTKVVPCPPGEYLGLTSEPTVGEIVSKKTGISYPQLTLYVSIDDPRVTDVTQRKPTKVRYQTLLDLNEAGNLDMGPGRNINLGRLREACGCNQPGKPFAIRDLGGKMVKARVTNRPDPNDSSILYDEVKALAPAS